MVEFSEERGDKQELANIGTTVLNFMLPSLSSH